MRILQGFCTFLLPLLLFFCTLCRFSFAAPWHWTPLSPGGVSPAQRGAHTAVYVEDPGERTLEVFVLARSASCFPVLRLSPLLPLLVRSSSSSSFRCDFILRSTLRFFCCFPAGSIPRAGMLVYGGTPNSSTLIPVDQSLVYLDMLTPFPYTWVLYNPANPPAGMRIFEFCSQARTHCHTVSCFFSLFSARCYHSAIFLPTDHSMVVYGGNLSPAQPTANSTLLADMWKYFIANNTWIRICTSTLASFLRFCKTLAKKSYSHRACTHRTH